MTIRLVFAALHLLGLGLGLGAVWARGLALGAASDVSSLRRAFYADSWWGVAAVVWLVTGLTRLFASLEKTPTYYYHNSLFWSKMALLALILTLEVRPMLTLIRWRTEVARGAAPTGTSAAPTLARISFVQAALVVIMVFVAAAMARGYGA